MATFKWSAYTLFDDADIHKGRYAVAVTLMAVGDRSTTYTGWLGSVTVNPTGIASRPTEADFMLDVSMAVKSKYGISDRMTTVMLWSKTLNGIVA